jgi:hypothetical protein
VHRKDASIGEALIARLTDPAAPGLCKPDRARMLRYAYVLRSGFFELERFEPVIDRLFASYLKNRAFQDMFRETLPCCLRAQIGIARRSAWKAFMGVIDDHARIVESGTVEENHMMFLWQLLNLETWLDALRDISGKRR